LIETSENPYETWNARKERTKEGGRLRGEAWRRVYVGRPTFGGEKARRFDKGVLSG
jgi:hypothetical protein